MKPKFTELTDAEQARIIEGEYIRCEKPIGERSHLQRMLKHLKKLSEQTEESLAAVLDEVPPDKEQREGGKVT